METNEKIQTSPFCWCFIKILTRLNYYQYVYHRHLCEWNLFSIMIDYKLSHTLICILLLNTI